ncbi:hypothetical protein O3S80_01430 [Streptomyces sp. Lzd4kr]|nr:hypothetical protein [Streptomyces sp. Lzd4kr]
MQGISAPEHVEYANGDAEVTRYFVLESVHGATSCRERDGRSIRWLEASEVLHQVRRRLHHRREGEGPVRQRR